MRKSCEIYALRSWEGLTFPKWARKYSKSIEIQNKQKNKVQNWKCINKAKMEMLIERDLLLLITLRRRRKPRVWARQIYWESTIPLTATSVSLNWLSGLCIVTFLLLFGCFRRSHPEVLPEKDVLKIYSKFTGEHPCLSMTSIKLQSNLIEIALRHGCSPINLLHIFRTPFTKNTSGRPLLLFSYIFEMLKKCKWYS